MMVVWTRAELRKDKYAEAGCVEGEAVGLSGL